jgi:aspartate/methionine/tyrosine aminotransferase
MDMQNRLIAALREQARLAPESGIVEIANYSWGREGIIPLWAGEGDLPTPQFICDAAARSMAAGETFYTWQRGIPELRAALAAYHGRQFGRSFTHERFFVTGSGMQAIQIAVACVAGPGDEVVIPTPAWPNMAAALDVAGARPVHVELVLDGDHWSLDLDRLFAATGPATRAIFINSPANPTGWTATEEELRAILVFAREKGLWIIADEVYNRFVYDRDRAPSFYDVMEESDQILFVNTFSKNWAMTGWRIGWLAAPPELGQVIENLIQYSTSGVAAFMQRAAVAALEDGETFVAEQVARAGASRQIICDALAGSNRVRFARPDGAFYLLFSVDGEPDTRKLALRLVDEAGIAMAPGTAFGPGAEPYLRICFARKPDDMAEAARRLSEWLAG